MAPRGLEINGLRVARARQGIPGCPSQAEFARSVGIHWVTQSRIENGKHKVSLDLLERLAEKTGTSRDYLLGDGDEEEEAASMAAPLSPAEFEMLGHLMTRLGPTLAAVAEQEAVKS